jgi:nucleoside-diphosphate-sugar epimerase
MEEGHEVFGIRRDISKLQPGVAGIAGNMERPESLGPAPSRVEYVVFAASPDEGSERAYRRAYLDGLAGLLEWLADEGQRPKRIVMTSSTSVYGQRRGEYIDEDSPTHPTHFRGETLLASEGLLAASGLSYVVVRLAGIYGPGRTGLIDRGKAGELRLRGYEHFTNRIHRDDVAGLLRHLLFHEAPASLYLGVDQEPADEATLFRWLAEELEVDLPTEEEPSEGESGRRLVGSKRCSNRLARESGYRFLYPTFRQGYHELIRQGSWV